MRFNKLRAGTFIGASLTCLALANAAQAEEAVAAESEAPANEIVVTGQATSFSNSAVTEEMFLQQTPLTSPLSAIDNLPGVSVNEGDAFGFDDWSTTVAIRGFQTNLDTQQIGITIDGMPNGGSNYGGGAKANRYIDSMNIGGIAVSQGTADIASRSNEALGGTLDFLTSNPENEQRMRFSASVGQFDALRYYARFDTGRILGDEVKAWFSASHQEATDWVNGSAQNRRDHFAGKFQAGTGPVKITGYASYDDTHEDNYEQLYDAASFVLNPKSDTLTDEWSGIPWIDQMYRRGWSTLRKNFFTYLKADAELGNGINLTVGGYY
ncbi:MAG TPA: TonB-dependent receptor plug domain-containing protein, partial [Sphingomonadaceae bacterium]|nr:TonB-dependent receptor plug domain-containing protein [Sphingomonadaceae bacterium]